MNDVNTGYRVFVRTMMALVFIYTSIWVLYFSVFGIIGTVDRPLVTTLDYQIWLHFWLLILAAFYSFISFCTGQFFWPLGPRPTLARLLVVFLAVAIILTLLTPLIQKGWLTSGKQIYGSQIIESISDV